MTEGPAGERGDAPLVVRPRVASTPVRFVSSLQVCLLIIGIAKDHPWIIFAILLIFAIDMCVVFGAGPDQPPLMVIDESGVTLPCAEDAFVTHDLVESWWIERHLQDGRVWRTLSLRFEAQCRVSVSDWAQAAVEAESLFGRGLVFDGRSVGVPLDIIVAALELQRARFATEQRVSALPSP